MPNNNWLDGCTAQLYVYNGGTNNSKVELYKVTGGAHVWPGSGLIIGSGTCMDFNSSAVIWQFFRQYTLSGLTTGVNEATAPSENMISLYPNPNRGVFTLNIPAGPAQIRIINSLGQIIQQANVDNKENIIIKINDKGVYFLQVTTAGESLVKKIVVSD